MQEFESKHGWLDVQFDPIVLAELSFFIGIWLDLYVSVILAYLRQIVGQDQIPCKYW